MKIETIKKLLKSRNINDLRVGLEFLAKYINPGDYNEKLDYLKEYRTSYNNIHGETDMVIVLYKDFMLNLGATCVVFTKKGQYHYKEMLRCYDASIVSKLKDI